MSKTTILSHSLSSPTPKFNPLPASSTAFAMSLNWWKLQNQTLPRVFLQISMFVQHDLRTCFVLLFYRRGSFWKAGLKPRHSSELQAFLSSLVSPIWRRRHQNVVPQHCRRRELHTSQRLRKALASLLTKRSWRTQLPRCESWRILLSFLTMAAFRASVLWWRNTTKR